MRREAAVQFDYPRGDRERNVADCPHDFIIPVEDVGAGALQK
jgi:hypothetical protein